MPLKRDSSDKSFRMNVSFLIREGYLQEQAELIALQIQKKSASRVVTAEEKLSQIDFIELEKIMDSIEAIEDENDQLSKRYDMGSIKDIGPSGKHLIYYTTETKDLQLLEDVKFWNMFMDELDSFPYETHIENEEDRIIIVSNIHEEDEYEFGKKKTGASTPAPAKDRIKGSEKNKPGTAKGPGGDIDIDESTEAGLKNKVSEHNEKMKKLGKPDWSKATLGQLKAVYRRGAGAYSQSHRPGVSRGAWAMARVNAYLYLLKNGRPKSKNYVTDNDLLPEKHPKSTR